MSAVATRRVRGRPERPGPSARGMRVAAAGRAREFARVVRAEGAKLRTMWRWWAAGAGTVVVAAVCAVVFVDGWLRGGVIADTAVQVGLRAIAYAQPGFVLVGILAGSLEYDDGQARATFTAMPRRGMAVAAKAVATAAHTLPIAAVTVVLVVGVAAAAMGGRAPLGDLGVAASAVGVAVALAVGGVGLGLLARSALWAGLPATVWLAVVGPVLRDALPNSLWLPDTSAYRLVHPELFAAQGPAWAACAILAGWTIGAVAAAAAMVRWRDA